MSPSVAPIVVPVDGRQSETALLIARGTRRYLRARGFATLAEMPLRSGRRADLVAIGRDGAVFIIEIKSSVADYRADAKWPEYREHCDRLYFAVTADMPRGLIAPDAGLIVADGYGADLVREAPEHRLSSATRRMVTLQFARLAANRLHGLCDPQLRQSTEEL